MGTAATSRRRRRPWWRRLPAVAAAASIAVAAQAAEPAAAEPMRIVSTNVCADQLLLLLADRSRITSVTYLAVDPHTSVMAAEAAGLDLNAGRAEEIVALDPDLVLAGAFTARPGIFLLRRLGYRVVELPVVSTFDDIRRNIRTVAEAVGRPDRGETLIEALARDLPPERAPGDAPAPVAALYWANSFSSGHGTLADAVVRRAGFRNLAAELGLSGSARLPLEVLLAAEPDILVIGEGRAGAALAAEPLRHPALARRFAGHRTAHIPDNLWVCGTPAVAEAVRRLAALRERPASPRAPTERP